MLKRGIDVHFVADFLLVNVLAGLSVAVDMWMAIVSALSMFDNKLAPFWNERKALEWERGH